METLPFSRADFFEVFRAYNERVWPAQLVLYALALSAVLILLLRRSSMASRGAAAMLAILWLWMGLVYHAGFFARINPAANFFAAAFVVQALLFVVLGTIRKDVLHGPRNDPAGWAGGALVIAGLFVYPLWSVMSGRPYVMQPTFGLPCPTTIFTLGVLLWSLDTAPRFVFIIPSLWAVTGTIAARQLGVTEDLALGASLAVVLTVWLLRLRSARRSGKVGPIFRNPLIEG